MTRDAELFHGGKMAWRIALAATALGFALTVAGAFADARQTAIAYLAAYSFAATVALGAAAFVMAAHAMSATWPVPLRRLGEATAATLPLLAILLLPLLGAIGLLYPWMHPDELRDHHRRELLIHKLPLMNPIAFGARALAYVIAWSLIAHFLRRWSLAMDRPGATDLRPRLRRFSSALLAPLGITGSFAAFDWLMSLSPDFYSTAFGLYLLAGGFVAWIGLLALLAWWAQRAGFLVAVRRPHWYAIGRLLFAFLIFWAYIAFFQLLIIWLGNKPIEVRFYLDRLRPADRAAAWFLAIGHFALPWLLLLSYAVKRNRSSVALLGAWICAAHYVDVHWLVGAARAPRASWQWQDLPALLFVAGACVAFALWRQRGHLLAPLHDPDFAAGAAYESR